jgi:hypothetical protein
MPAINKLCRVFFFLDHFFNFGWSTILPFFGKVLETNTKKGGQFEVQDGRHLKQFSCTFYGILVTKITVL